MKNHDKKVAGYCVRIGYTNHYFRRLEEAEKFFFDYCVETYEDFIYEYKTSKNKSIEIITWGDLWEADEEGYYYLDDADELRNQY